MHNPNLLPVPLYQSPYPPPGTITIRIPEGLGRTTQLLLTVAAIGAFAWFLRWELALAFVLHLGLIDLGRRWAERRCGLRTRSLFLVPFGTAFLPGETPRTRGDESYVALMGPTLSLAGLPLVFAALWAYAGTGVASAITSVLVFYSLATLVPLPPLDGGRLVKAAGASFHPLVGRAMLVLAPVVIAAAAGTLRSLPLACLIPLGLIEFFREARARPFPMGSLGAAIAIAWWLVLLVTTAILAVALALVPGIETAADTLLRL